MDDFGENSVIDIAIIGAGPAGLSAAINAYARGKSSVVFSVAPPYIEKAKEVNNHLGFINISGKDMMDKFREHVESVGIEIKHGRVSNIIPFGDMFMINFAGDIVNAKTVIIATGVSKGATVKGESDLLGRGVSYCATCDGRLYCDRNAVVWGLSEDAVEEANFLKSVGVKVAFVGKADKEDELDAGITYIKGKIKSISGEGRVEKVSLEKDGALSELDAEAVFILRNSISPSTLIPTLEIKDSYVSVNEKMETNIKGIYAAGDCTGQPLQISNAVGDGLVAAQMAAKYIDSLS